MQVSSIAKNIDIGSFTADYNFTFWDTGLIKIPNIGVLILDMDSTLIDSMNTQSYLIDVISVKQKNPRLKPEDGTILPIKAPVPVKKKVASDLIYQLIALILLALFLIYLWTKRINEKKHERELESIKASSYEIALKKLKKLKKIDLTLESNKKIFYVDLSFILREYIEKSFFIRTLEMTTNEIKENRFLLPFDERSLDDFLKILQISDMVKYAKYDSEEFKNNLDDAIKFVQNTLKYLDN